MRSRDGHTLICISIQVHCDTVASVALKHGMPVARLKKWNKLLSPTLYAGQTLAVEPPRAPTPEELRAASIRAVMKSCSCDKHEAAYYLDEHGGGVDVDAALAARAADAQGTPQLPVEGWVVVGALSDSIKN